MAFIISLPNPRTTAPSSRVLPAMSSRWKMATPTPRLPRLLSANPLLPDNSTLGSPLAPAPLKNDSTTLVAFSSLKNPKSARYIVSNFLWRASKVQKFRLGEGFTPRFKTYETVPCCGQTSKFDHKVGKTKFCKISTLWSNFEV